MIKRWDEMSRSDFIWLSLFAAIIQALFFGLAEMYLPALICVYYCLIIVVCNMIAETRDEIKRSKRK